MARFVGCNKRSALHQSSIDHRLPCDAVALAPARAASVAVEVARAATVEVEVARAATVEVEVEVEVAFDVDPR
jgi:hypothetical protein